MLRDGLKGDKKKDITYMFGFIHLKKIYAALPIENVCMFVEEKMGENVTS